MDNSSLPASMTTCRWDSTHVAFRGSDAMGKFHDIWNVGAQTNAFGLGSADDCFDKLTWTHAPAGERGGEPKNLSRWPILSSPNLPLAKWETVSTIPPSRASLKPSSERRPVRFYSVHLNHLSTATRLPQIERIFEILNAAPHEEGARCGILNLRPAGLRRTNRPCRTRLCRSTA